MLVEEQKTTDILDNMLSQIDLSDMTYQNMQFEFGYPSDIALRVSKNPNGMPLVVLFYSDLKEVYDFESPVYLNSSVRLYIMLPSNFKKLDQEETYTNAINVAQTIIHRLVELSEIYPGVNKINSFESDPQENWNMIVSNKELTENGKIQILSDFVFPYDLSGRDMKFNLEILKKYKCN